MRRGNRLAAAVQPEGVLETCLYARNLAAAEAFYTRVLGLQVVAREAQRHVFFRCGSGMLLVFNPVATAGQETTVNGALVPLHGAEGAGHVAFRIRPPDLAAWRERLRSAGVEIESEVHWPQGGESVYFRDPAGNSLELATPNLWGLA